MSFDKNLKLLCSYYPSIAEVSRQTGINRTQLNKYLNGQVKPSKSNIRIICDFFGIEEFEAVMPYEQFIEQVIPEKINKKTTGIPFFDKAIQLHKDSLNTLTRYTGWYYEYYFSLGYPGQVFKSLIHIRPGDTGTEYKRYERLVPAGRFSEAASHCLYHGAMINLYDRIFMLDIESLTENEITQTVLFPSYRSQIKYLHGIKIGVSSRSHRSPASTRVLLEFIGHEISFKERFRQCGLYQPEDMPQEIISLIENKKDDTDTLFYALEG